MFTTTATVCIKAPVAEEWRVKWLVETGEAPPAKGPLLPVPATC